MTKVEQVLWRFIDKNSKWLFLAIVSLLAGVIRYIGKDFMSGDMHYFLIPWYDNIKSLGGLQGLGTQVGNYNILYQTIIALFTYLNINSIYLYKILSCLFDFFLAFSCGYIICDWLGKNWRKDRTFDFVYAVFLFLPTVILNSAYWGQCDSIYVSFIIWTIYLLFKGKYRLSFLVLGIALAFKLQSVFIVPFLIYFYCYNRKFSIFYFLYTIGAFWLSGIVGYLQGRNLLDGFRIYLHQTDTYHEMYMNISSFWLLVGNSYASLNRMALILTVVILGIGLYIVLVYKKKINTPSTFLSIAVWSVWTVILFLPAMHERYTYMLDILLVMICVLNWRYLPFAIGETILSLITYGYYLFGSGSINIVFAVVNVILWISFGLTLGKFEFIDKKDSSERTVKCPS